MDCKRSYCFVSNYLTPHQLPFCLAMQKETGTKFFFIETAALPEERKRLGYPNLGGQYDFVLNATINTETFKQALKIANESDVVIIGSAPDRFIEQRLNENKLTFRFSERIFKKSYFDPFRWGKYTLKNLKYCNKNLFFLLSSAYAAHDYKRCGIREDKMFKWGYFPEVSKDISVEIKKEHRKCVWVGRFLAWKHPDDAIRAVIQLNKKGYEVSLELIGDGEMSSFLHNIVERNNAESYISFKGNQPYEKVRDYMRGAEIFLFTSDYNEGWGAVLNEAMDSGCVVVASHAAGSVPYLIKNNENGLIYNFEERGQLVEKIENVLQGKVSVKAIERCARETVAKEWSASNATKKLIDFCDAFFAGDYKKGIQEEGIFSYAHAIPQKEMYDSIKGE